MRLINTRDSQCNMHHEAGFASIAKKLIMFLHQPSLKTFIFFYTNAHVMLILSAQKWAHIQLVTLRNSSWVVVNNTKPRFYNLKSLCINLLMEVLIHINIVQRLHKQCTKSSGGVERCPLCPTVAYLLKCRDQWFNTKLPQQNITPTFPNTPAHER